MSVTIDVALLTQFVQVADAASFSAAARTLGTTTATVSRGVARLEASVGSRLLHRTTRRVSLTTAGKALYERTAPHVRALAHAAKEMPEQQDEPAGLIKLAAPFGLAATLLGGVIARFIERYPKVQVQAELGSRMVDLAGEGFDVALRSDRGTVKDSSLTARRLAPRGELGAYAAPGYLSRRGQPSGLASPDHDWLVAGPLRRVLGFPATVTPRVVADDFLFLRSIAIAGGGIATLPSFMAQAHVASGERRARARAAIAARQHRRAGNAVFVVTPTRAQGRGVSRLPGRGDAE